MKNIVLFGALSLVVMAYSKVDTGTYTISGRLLDNCENQEPVANQSLYFLVDWESAEEDRIAYTDANGYFKYTFDGPPNNESVIGGSIRTSSEKLVLCGIPNSSFNKDMDAGTIYANPPREAEVTFRIHGQGYTDQDTVVIAKVFHSDLSRVTNLLVAGPFDPEVVITREWIKYASSGTGTMSDYTKMTQPFVKRLKGTFGTYCRWQVNKGNQLGEVQLEQVLLDVCENTATIDIDLDNLSE